MGTPGWGSSCGDYKVSRRLGRGAPYQRQLALPAGSSRWNLLRPMLVEHQACSIASEATMNGLIYLVGLVVVIMFILSFLGLR